MPSRRLRLSPSCADIDAARDLEVVCVSVEQSVEALRGGAHLSLTIPADAPPTCETDGLRVGYRLRAVIDRAWRTDAVHPAASERRLLRGEALHLAPHSLVLLRFGKARRTERRRARGAHPG